MLQRQIHKCIHIYVIRQTYLKMLSVFISYIYQIIVMVFLECSLNFLTKTLISQVYQCKIVWVTKDSIQIFYVSFPNQFPYDFFSCYYDKTDASIQFPLVQIPLFCLASNAIKPYFCWEGSFKIKQYIN